MQKQKINKRAFTLIEVLIVIAIIAILFVVVFTTMDTAVDKAKIAGVQNDFRSYQLAIEAVALENDGFNTFGWDLGDLNGDRICNSYDEKDTNKNGIQDANEEDFTGVYISSETWTDIYTLINPADPNDYTAITNLQKALNKKLDPELQIIIDIDGNITMMNDAKDPWGNQYAGKYLTNATSEAASLWNTDTSMISTGDYLDRGAIVLWSTGANGNFGTKVKVDGGLVSSITSLIDAETPDSNPDGSDDIVMSIIYSYRNGFGQAGTTTLGFSNNQTFLAMGPKPVSIFNPNPTPDNKPNTEEVPDNNSDNIDDVNTNNNNKPEDNLQTEQIQYEMLTGDHKLINKNNMSFTSSADFDKFVRVEINGTEIDESNYVVENNNTTIVFNSDFFDTIKNTEDPLVLRIVSNDGWAECVVEIEKEEPLQTLQDYTWETLQWLSQRNLSSDVLSEIYGIKVGDKKIHNGIEYTLVDIDNYNGFVFMYDTGLSMQANTHNSNVGGYKSSNLQKEVDKLYSSMDSDIKKVIKNVHVDFSTNPNSNNSIDSVPCHLFVPSIKELNFMISYNTPGWDNEGDVFEWFETNENALINMFGEYNVWLRSIDYSNTTNFQYAMSGYSAWSSSFAATSEMHVFACFVIG